MEFSSVASGYSGDLFGNSKEEHGHCESFIVQHEERNMSSLERRYCPPRYVDTYDNGTIIEGMWRNEIGNACGMLEINQTGSSMFAGRARETREEFENYFVSDVGKVE